MITGRCKTARNWTAIYSVQQHELCEPAHIKRIMLFGPWGLDFKTDSSKFLWPTGYLFPHPPSATFLIFQFTATTIRCRNSTTRQEFAMPHQRIAQDFLHGTSGPNNACSFRATPHIYLAGNRHPEPAQQLFTGAGI